ncbi:universal stress protein [Pseudogemmobacter sp. W21_MBD1_M6]|uniref:universal stress protein n=1 Tax=Pseudogemmobacter sp. W21_MBD1_M6 TaxID=3240271 RepID=UPI003F9571DC
MTPILVATDLSARSDRAVQRAFRLAQGLGCGLTVVSIVDSSLPVDMAETLREDVERRLARMTKDVARITPCKYSCMAVLGDISLDLPDIAEDQNASLIVLGQHRPRGLADLIRQTTMERLVRGSRRPVLIVRDPVLHDYGQVLAPVDFGPSSAEAVRVAARIAPLADIHMVHALHIPFGGLTGAAALGIEVKRLTTEAEAERRAWLADALLPKAAGLPEIVQGSLHQVFTAQMAQRQPDLVAVGAHARTGTAPFILGSFANDLMRELPCDLLVARPARE